MNDEHFSVHNACLVAEVNGFLYELGDRDEFCCLFRREISAQSTGMKSEKHNQNIETQTSIFRDCRSLVDAYNFTIK